MIYSYSYSLLLGCIMDDKLFDKNFDLLCRELSGGMELIPESINFYLEFDFFNCKDFLILLL